VVGAWRRFQQNGRRSTLFGVHVRQGLTLSWNNPYSPRTLVWHRFAQGAQVFDRRAAGDFTTGAGHEGIASLRIAIAHGLADRVRRGRKTPATGSMLPAMTVRVPSSLRTCADHHVVDIDDVEIQRCETGQQMGDMRKCAYGLWLPLPSIRDESLLPWQDEFLIEVT